MISDFLSPKVPPASEGGRSGVAKSETRTDHFEGRVSALERVIPEMEQVLRKLGGQQVVRENRGMPLVLNTNAAPLTNAEGQGFDCTSLFGGPGNSLAVFGVGGGTLEVNINGLGWFPVVRGDAWRDLWITSVRVRVTTGAAGTARLWLGAYVEE